MVSRLVQPEKAAQSIVIILLKSPIDIKDEQSRNVVE